MRRASCGAGGVLGLFDTLTVRSVSFGLTGNDKPSKNCLDLRVVGVLTAYHYMFFTGWLRKTFRHSIELLLGETYIVFVVVAFSASLEGSGSACRGVGLYPDDVRIVAGFFGQLSQTHAIGTG